MPNTTNYDIGDVLLIEILFTNQRQSEKRPAVVISTAAYNQSHSDIIVMPITTQSQSADVGAVPVIEWQQSGLIKPSFIKPVIGTYEQSEVIRPLGKISDQKTRVALKKAIAQILGFKQVPASST